MCHVCGGKARHIRDVFGRRGGASTVAELFFFGFVVCLCIMCWLISISLRCWFFGIGLAYANEVAEWSKALVLKTSKLTFSQVRILSSPAPKRICTVV